MDDRKVPSERDSEAQSLFGLEEDAKLFNEIKGAIIQICLAQFPEPTSDWAADRKIVMELAPKALGSFRRKYMQQMLELETALAEHPFFQISTTRAEDYVAGWASQVNRSAMATREARPYRCQESNHRLKGDTIDPPGSNSEGKDSMTAKPGPRVRFRHPEVDEDTSPKHISASQPKETTRKRSLDEYEDDILTSEGSSAELQEFRGIGLAHKAVHQASQPKAQQTIQQSCLSSITWRGVIMHFKAGDSKVRGIRVPLLRFRVDPANPFGEIHPYRLKVDDLAKYLDYTPFKQYSPLYKAYVRLAGRDIDPKLLDDGELSSLFVDWEQGQESISNPREIIFELWHRQPNRTRD